MFSAHYFNLSRYFWIPILPSFLLTIPLALCQLQIWQVRLLFCFIQGAEVGQGRGLSLGVLLVMPAGWHQGAPAVFLAPMLAGRPHSAFPFGIQRLWPTSSLSYHTTPIVRGTPPSPPPCPRVLVPPGQEFSRAGLILGEIRGLLGFLAAFSVHLHT